MYSVAFAVGMLERSCRLHTASVVRSIAGLLLFLSCIVYCVRARSAETCNKQAMIGKVAARVNQWALGLTHPLVLDFSNPTHPQIISHFPLIEPPFMTSYKTLIGPNRHSRPRSSTFSEGRDAKISGDRPTPSHTHLFFPSSSSLRLPFSPHLSSQRPSRGVSPPPAC